MAANKILNTSNTLYGNIVRALSGDDELPMMRDLTGKLNTRIQEGRLGFAQYTHSTAVSGATFIAQQGIARNATHWFGVSTSSIKKYDLTGVEVSSNASPFTSLPAGVDHCGSSFVLGLYLYVPVVNWDGATQTATSQTIAKYLVSDLSYDSHFDISAQAGCDGSGLCLSPSGTEIYVTSYTSIDTRLDNSQLYSFDLTTGAFIEILYLDTPSFGTQGMVWTGEYYYVTSWVSPDSRINVYDKNFKFQRMLYPISTPTEIEGITYYDGQIYFHTVDNPLRKLDISSMLIAKITDLGTPVKLIEGSDMGDAGTILLNVYIYQLFDYNPFIDNLTDANTWELFGYEDGRIGWRVDTLERVAGVAGTLSETTAYKIAVTWEKVGGLVTVKLGLNGAYIDTNAAGTWVSAPDAGLWLGGKNAGNNANGYSDTVHSDVLVFDKVLSDAELLDAYNNFDSFYAALPTSIANITATGIPDGTYQTVLFSGTAEVFNSTLTYTSGAATTPALSVAASTALTGYVIDNEATPVDGAVITGTTA